MNMVLIEDKDKEYAASKINTRENIIKDIFSFNLIKAI